MTHWLHRRKVQDPTPIIYISISYWTFLLYYDFIHYNILNDTFDYTYYKQQYPIIFIDKDEKNWNKGKKRKSKFKTKIAICVINQIVHTIRSEECLTELTAEPESGFIKQSYFLQFWNSTVNRCYMPLEPRSKLLEHELREAKEPNIGITLCSYICWCDN